MLREHAKAVERIVAGVDLLLVALSLVAANAALGRYPLGSLVREYGPFLLGSALVWLVLLSYAGFYQSLRTREYLGLTARVAQTALLAGVLNAAILFLTAPQFSRAVYGLHVTLAFGLMLAWKLLLRGAQKAARRRGYNFRRLLVVGTRAPALRFIRHVEEHKDWGYQVVGCVQGSQGPEKAQCEGYPVVGRLESLVELCKAQPVDEVIFTLPVEYLRAIDDLLPRLEAMGVTVRVAMDYFRPAKSRVQVGLLGDRDSVPVVTYHRATLDPTQLLLKRLLDLGGAWVGLALAGLLLPFVALAIKLDSPGPIFFGQKRVGQNGRLFTCYKFRTMYADAEARKHELLAQNEMKGAIFKIKDDPRITPVGRFLRRTSIDELPQFLNVLRGEMSLVGTRPPTPDEVARYEEWHRGRICIKPGLTGMWQTAGRNKVDDFDEICRLDLSYIDNWSLSLDLKLLAKTVGVVLLGAGAS
ncbi:MAG: sugar transferase [Deferrisomatales bacterium]